MSNPNQNVIEEMRSQESGHLNNSKSINNVESAESSEWLPPIQQDAAGAMPVAQGGAAVAHTPATPARPVTSTPPVDSGDEITFDTARKEVCPAGVYPGVCIDWFDFGLQPGYHNESPKKKIGLYFEVAQKYEDGPLKGRGFRLAKTFTATCHEKGSLAKFVKSWMKIEISKNPKALKKSDFIGRQCTIVVDNVDRAGATKANITSVLPSQAGAPKVVTNYDKKEIPPWVRERQAQALPTPQVKK